MRIEESIFIRRSPDDVFAFLEERSNDSAWMGAVGDSNWLDAAEPVGVGRRGRMVLKSMVGPREFVDEVTVYEPGRRIAHRSVQGPMELETSCATESVSAGCRAIVTAEAESLGQLAVPGRIGRLAGPLLVGLIRRGFKADLAKLKRILEAEA
jgi:uncharacterized protein YndB with AHSA1/START domain